MRGSTGRPYCFVDFDGTLVDNRRRMYQFCCDHCFEGFGSAMTIDEYWTLKRLGVSELDVVNRVLGLGLDPAAYRDAKLAHMEDERYLEMDELIPGTEEALSLIGRHYVPILVSRREHPGRLARQVSALGIAQFFDGVIVIPHGGGSKADAIRARGIDTGDAVMVGDTEDDIDAGLGLGADTVFVLSGVRSRAWALRYPRDARLAVHDRLEDYAKSIIVGQVRTC